MNKQSKHYESTGDKLKQELIAPPKTICNLLPGGVIPPLVGTKEVAAIFGWGKGKVSEYMRRGKLPEPIQRLASGPVWRKSDIVKFKEGL